MTADAGCPNCETPGLEPFYEARSIPAHTCLMFDDRDSAVRYPTRDLQLGFCKRCGFIWNVVFDPEVQAYAAGYEEQQSFSPRFREFQTKLCRELVERYDLRDKDVVEIGCGKGDFLVELCEAGGNRGVGIDPACDPKRIQDCDKAHVRFVADYYSEAYADLPCNLLCCRHTLEHIHQTNEFVGLVRRVVGDRTNTLVFFDVPAVERVLQEAAFWDIYYEHCSYFSLGSLARLFRANRFELLELEKDYDDQYLSLVARPTSGPTGSSWPREDDLGQLARNVQKFSKLVSDRLAGWRNRFESWKDEKKRVVIWGSGSKCVAFLGALGVSEQVAGIVDVNPYRQGKYLVSSGQCVVGPESLRAEPPDIVLAMNPIYRDEIQRDLQAMDIHAELVAV